MFSGGHRKSLTTSELSAGQSLFDFLKSKKKSTVESSIGKSRAAKSRSIAHDFLNHQIPNIDDLELHTELKYNANTPKKVSFVETSEVRPNKSFIQMISPMSKKQNSSEQKKYELGNQRPSSILKSSKKQKQNRSDSFSRKNLNQSVKVLKETIQNLMGAGRKIKDRAHGLFLEMKPILKAVEEGNQKGLSKKAEHAKDNFRTFEFLLKDFEVDNANQTVQIFHRNLSEHIIAMEGRIKADYESSEMKGYNKLKQQKQEQIHQLQAENQRLNQIIENLSKKMQKAEKISKSRVEEDEIREQQYKEKTDHKIARLEQIMKKLEEGNQNLKDQLQDSERERKNVQKKLKDSIYAKDEIEKRLLEENMSIKSQREQILLNQIKSIKLEFQRDMQEVTQLYSSKEQEQDILVNQLKNQLQEIKREKQIDRENSSRIYCEGEGLRVLITKYKKQNECLVTDMHRMNEQLYQHWLALKDVRTLAIRLHLMPKFSKIFQDLPFNDQLFS